MDENMDQGFPIPSNRPMFGGEAEEEPAIGGDTFKAFTSEEGDQAVVLATAEVADGEVIARLSDDELQDYAEGLFEEGIDDRDLQIGEIFEGDTAGADAESEATRLNQEYSPEDDSDEALATAIEGAKGSPSEPFPDDEEADELGAELAEEDEDLGGEAEEPMLEQLKNFGG